MAVYLMVSILALSALNLGRTIAFSLTTELPTPHWRNYFLCLGSEIFTLGRGVGPILAGAIDDKQRIISALLIACALAAIVVSAAHARSAFDHEGHELGPARAEQGDDLHDDVASVVQSVDEWLAALYSAEVGGAASGGAPSKMKSAPSREGGGRLDAKQLGRSHKQGGL